MSVNIVILWAVYWFFLHPHYRELFRLNGTSANCICEAGAKPGNQVCCRTRPKYYTESSHFIPPSLSHLKGLRFMFLWKYVHLRHCNCNIFYMPQVWVKAVIARESMITMFLVDLTPERDFCKLCEPHDICEKGWDFVACCRKLTSCILQNMLILSHMPAV